MGALLVSHARLLVLSIGVSLCIGSAALAGIGVGDPAPAVPLADATGQDTTLESFRGQVVVLDFTASWCVACRTALPELEKLGRRYADRGVVVVTVVIDAPRAEADRFLATVVPGHTMSVLYDPKARALARFGAAGMPAHYVLDRQGVVRFVASGYTPDRADAIAAVLERLIDDPVAAGSP